LLEKERAHPVQRELSRGRAGSLTRIKINFTQRFNTWLFRTAGRRLLFDFSEVYWYARLGR
jgi:hypothetical protein